MVIDMNTELPALKIHCIGISHRTASIEVREKIWFSQENVRSILPELKQEGYNECVLISTCNRTELYYVAAESSANESPAWRRLAAPKQAQDVLKEEHFYSLQSVNAVKHLYRLASGVDSMVLGDVQILAQIKSAFGLAQELGTTGPLLNKLFATALHIGKRVRSETEIGDGAVSVGYAAAELASKIFRDLSTRTALLIGAGETGELTAKHLRGHNLGTLLITNRTRERAEVLSTRLNGTVIDFDLLKSYLPRVDIIISSIAVPTAILTKDDLRESMRHRGNDPAIIIDLGVPRNIDPEACSISNVFLHDIDSLNHIVDKNLKRRMAELPNVNEIILEELISFYRWYNSLELTPTIQALRNRFEEIRLSEVEKYYHHFSPELQKEIGIVTRRIVNKILHTPMVNLRRESVGEEGQRYITLLRSVFGLDELYPAVKSSSDRGAK